MARTLNANWLRAFRQSTIKPVVLLSIQFDERGDDPENPFLVSWVSGDRPLFGHPCSIANVSTISTELDPITRRVALNEITVTFIDDGTLRYFARTLPLKNRRSTLKLGTSDLAEADFEVIADGLRIQEVLPSPGQIEISLLDTRAEVLEIRDPVFEFPDHPWKMMQRIFRRASMMNRTVAPDDNFSLAASDISHFVVTRHQYHPAPEDDVEPIKDSEEPLINRISSLAEITYSVIKSDPFGQAKVISWDPTPAIPAFAWGASDYDAIDQSSTYEDLITRIVCDYALSVKTISSRNHPRADVEIEPRYRAKDTVAENALRGPFWGIDQAISEHSIQSTFFSSGAQVGKLFSGGTLSTGATSLIVPLPLWHGFCGTLTTDAGIRQNPGSTDDEADEVLYGDWMTQDLYSPTLGAGVIRVDAMRDDTSSWDKAAIEATYSGVGNYSQNNLVVHWFDGLPVANIELGRAVVTSASVNGKWLFFEAIERSVAAGIGQLAINPNTVYYQIRNWSLTKQSLSSTINAAQQVTAMRPGYILLVDRGFPSKQEIVKTTAFAYQTGYGAETKVRGYATRNPEPNERQYWRRGEFTIERAQLGTTAQKFSENTFAIDITIAVYVAQKILERAHFGVPKLSLQVGLDKLGAEIGDIGTVESPLFLGHLVDGSTHSNITWEVISTEFDLYSDNPGIKIKLAAASVGGYTPANVVPIENEIDYARVYEVYIDASGITYFDGIASPYTTRY